MKKILILCGLILTTGTANAGQLVITSCSGDSASINAVGVKGKWLGFSVKTSSGEIRDVSPEKLNFGGLYQGILRFNGNNVISARASTWDKYKNGKMVNRREDTSWIVCN